MIKRDLARINPEVLKWAINRSGLEHSEIATAINVQLDLLELWENGYGYPQFSKALELAKTLHIPFGYFYLRNPPEIEIPLPDFRILKDTKAGKPSINFLDSLYQALSQQEWYRAYLLEQGAQPLSFLGQFTINDDPKAIAKDLIEILGMDDALRREAGNWSNYLTKLSQKAEKAGVIVMRRAVVGSSNRRKLSRDEFQGFTIFDSIAPLVFINGQDFESAKIFSLLHELAHVWIGQSGISNAERELGEKSVLEIESFCNSIAVEALVPEEEFLRRWQENPNYESIGMLAKHFLVSTLVILRRARELEKLSLRHFNDLLTEARRHLKDKEQPLSTGGNFYNTLDSRNSPKFVDALVSDVRREGTLYRDAARLLSVTVPTVEKMVEGTKSL